MNIALKEWPAVITALDRGAQIFLLRKGGCAGQLLAQLGRGVRGKMR